MDIFFPFPLPLTPKQWFYVAATQCLIAGIIDGAANFAIAYAMYNKQDSVKMWVFSEVSRRDGSVALRKRAYQRVCLYDRIRLLEVRFGGRTANTSEISERSPPIFLVDLGVTAIIQTAVSVSSISPLAIFDTI